MALAVHVACGAEAAAKATDAGLAAVQKRAEPPDPASHDGQSAPGVSKADDQGGLPQAKTQPSQREAEAGLPAKVYRYARRLTERYDRNADGKLQEEEWRRMPGQPARVDANGDRVITVEELVQWIAAYGARRRIRLAYPAVGWTEPPAAPDKTGGEEQAGTEAGAETTSAEQGKPLPAPEKASEKPAGTEKSRRDTKFAVRPKRIPGGLPDWFLARDTDGDGQLTLSEFAPRATAADREEFARYDLNADGIVTPQEYLKATKAAKSSKPRAKP